MTTDRKMDFEIYSSGNYLFIVNPMDKNVLMCFEFNKSETPFSMRFSLKNIPLSNTFPINRFSDAKLIPTNELGKATYDYICKCYEKKNLDHVSERSYSKKALNLSKQNNLSLHLCEVIVENATDNNSIFYTMLDLLDARRTVMRSSDYQHLLFSDDTPKKRELFKKIFEEETINTFEIDTCDDSLIDMLAEGLCS